MMANKLYFLKHLSIVFCSLFFSKSSPRFLHHVKTKIDLPRYIHSQTVLKVILGFHICLVSPLILQNHLKHRTFPFRSKYKAEKHYSWVAYSSHIYTKWHQESLITNALSKCKPALI